MTNATKAADAAQMARIRKEIDALKTLDLDKVVEQRLARGLGKIKAMADSGFLPAGWGQAGEGVKGWEGEKGEEEIKLWNNVVSGMWNFKVVKSVWEGVIRGSYMSMGIPAPVLEKGKKGKDKAKDKAKADEAKKNSRKEAQSEDGEESDVDMENTTQNSSDKKKKKKNEEESWDGFDSPGDDEDEDGSDDDEENEEGNDSIDEETLSRYDALLGASSDEESFDEEEYLKKNPSKSKANTRLSLSLSPTPSRSPSPAASISLSDDSAIIKSTKHRKSSPSPSPSPSSSPQPKAKKTKKLPAPDPTKNSTFLPTLMGGYWSGSESASSLSDTDMKPAVRKNRMGQKARQALWEKKFGRGAKHIAAGKMSMEQEREAKRAEKAGRKPRDLGRRPKADFRNDKGNANTVEVKARAGATAGTKARDDVGVLHPSWEAAKKAKEEKAKATFSGKKVVFD